MTDPLPEANPSGTKWLWVGVLVLLAIALVIFVFNADGDEKLETIPDEAITTTEERLNTPLRTQPTEPLPAAVGTPAADAAPDTVTDAPMPAEGDLTEPQ